MKVTVEIKKIEELVYCMLINNEGYTWYSAYRISDKITEILIKNDEKNLLEQENKELIRMLERLEYRVAETISGLVYEACPICERREYESHDPDCVLGKLLEKYKKKEKKTKWK